MTSGRVVELRRTFQDHILDALGSSMAMRGDGSNIGLSARTLCDEQAFLPIIPGAILPAVPRSLDDRWLQRNGLAYCIAAECGYAVGVGGNTHSDLMASISRFLTKNIVGHFPRSFWGVPGVPSPGPHAPGVCRNTFVPK